MGLHDRIKGGENGAGESEEQPVVSLVPGMGDEPKPEKNTDPYAELKTRVHHACIAKLGPQLFTTETSRGYANQPPLPCSVRSRTFDA